MLRVEIKPGSRQPMMIVNRNWVPQDKRNELREGFGDGSQNRNQGEQIMSLTILNNIAALLRKTS